jgi:hypothetical protein
MIKEATVVLILSCLLITHIRIAFYRPLLISMGTGCINQSTTSHDIQCFLMAHAHSEAKENV